MSLSPIHNLNSVSNALAADGRSLDSLKLAANRGDEVSALTEAAKHFESIFMLELLKNMRNATIKSGMFDSPQSDLTNDLLDQQRALQLSGRAGGLASILEKQLSKRISAHQGTNNSKLNVQRNEAQLSNNLQPLPASSSIQINDQAQKSKFYELDRLQRGLGPATPSILPTPDLDKPVFSVLSINNKAKDVSLIKAKKTVLKTPQEIFVNKHQNIAKRVEQQTGIPAEYLLGQAAHESGWGRREILNTDGSSAHNLFGIKAGSGWKGKVAEVTTTEYINGKLRNTKAQFRSYDSYEESFLDHARLINSKRYSRAHAIASVARDSQISAEQVTKIYAKELQRAGYATDPNYATKLSSVINSALKVQRTLNA